MAADLVVGMTTVLLVEACLLGSIVLSLQPGLRLPEALPTNRWGASRAVYRESEIAEAVASLLFDENAREELAARARQTRFDSNATGQVISLVEKMTGLGACEPRPARS
jgi:hypothetical protein